MILTSCFQAVDVMRSTGKSVRMVVDKCEPSYDAMSDSMTSIQSSQTLGKPNLFLFLFNIFLSLFLCLKSVGFRKIMGQL